MSNESKFILVIDDAEDTLEFISTKLTHLGYRVEATASGEKGVALAQLQHPDLILLDLMMPNVDGWEVLSRLKNDPATKEIPVVLMTAYASIQYSGEKQRAMELGAVDYLKKPFDLNEMVQMVKKYVG